MDKNEIIFKREKIIRNMRLENSNISYHELLNLLEELETKNNKIEQLKLEILKLNKIFIMEDINLLETEGRILKTYKAENRDLILELNIGDLKENYWYEVLVEDKRGISTYITRFKEEKFLKERKGRLGYIISRYFKNNIYFLIEEDKAWPTRRGDCNEK